VGVGDALGRELGRPAARWRGCLLGCCALAGREAKQARAARPSPLFFSFLFSFSTPLIRIQIWFLNLDSKLVHHIHWSF